MKWLFLDWRLFTLWLLFLYMTVKSRQYSEALHFVDKYQSLVSKKTLSENHILSQLINTIEKKSEEKMALNRSSLPFQPAILILNKHALNLTLNWLCNVAGFPDVLDKLIFFVFDRDSAQVLRKNWPSVAILFLPIEPMQELFKVGSGSYQLFQLFRANLATFLAENDLNFWMIQADTYWRANLFEKANPQRLMDDEQLLLFDKEGEFGLLAKMIAGGNFFVKGNKKTADFFDALAGMLIKFYSTDNNLMGLLCKMTFADVHCAYIPYKTLSNWRWHYGSQKQLPKLLQFDGGSSCHDKLEQLQNLGAAFAKFHRNNLITCDKQKMTNPSRAISKEILLRLGNRSSSIQISYNLFHWLCEILFFIWPDFFGSLFLTTVFPFYAYLIMI